MKLTYKRNILLYICALGLLSLQSCDLNNYSETTNYVYKNNSIHSIESIAYFNSEKTDQKVIKSFVLLEGQDTSFSITPEDWAGPLVLSPLAGADSLHIIYNDTLLQYFDISTMEFNPMRIENYELVEGEKEPYIYLFEFTEEDFQSAVERGRIIE